MDNYDDTLCQICGQDTTNNKNEKHVTIEPNDDISNNIVCTSCGQTIRTPKTSTKKT
jgi:hypothetical protein